MNREFTVVIEQGESHLIATVVELPGCYTQGDTLDELMVNIKEAIALYLDSESPDITTSFLGIQKVLV